MGRRLTIIDAFKDPRLFGGLPAFRDLTTWRPWLAWLRAVYGMPMGVEALELFRRHAGRIAILVIDVVLPGMSSADVVEEIQQLEPAIAVVHVSAHSQDWLLSQGRIGRGVEPLQKPFTQDALLARIGRRLGPNRL